MDEMISTIQDLILTAIGKMGKKNTKRLTKYLVKLQRLKGTGDLDELDKLTLKVKKIIKKDK